MIFESTSIAGPLRAREDRFTPAAQHLFAVAQSVGKGIQRAFRPTKVGLVIVGLEVPHVHLHVSPIDRLSDLDFAHANPSPDPAEMDRAAEKLRAALRELRFVDARD